MLWLGLGGYPCAYALGISLLFCVVQFSLFLQDSVTLEDEETTRGGPGEVQFGGWLVGTRDSSLLFGKFCRSFFLRAA